MANATALTAEQQNETRRATKKRQQSNKQAAAAAAKRVQQSDGLPKRSDVEIREIAHQDAVKHGLDVNAKIYAMLDDLEYFGSIRLVINDLVPVEMQALAEILEWNKKQALPLQVKNENDTCYLALPAPILHDRAVEYGKTINNLIYAYLDVLEAEGELVWDVDSLDEIEYRAMNELLDFNDENGTYYEKIDDNIITLSLKTEVNSEAA